MRADSLTGAGMDLTAEWNGVLASYLGVPTSAAILTADLFRSLPDVFRVQSGLSLTVSGKTETMNLKPEILSSLTGKVMEVQTTLVSLRNVRMVQFILLRAIQTMLVIKDNIQSEAAVSMDMAFRLIKIPDSVWKIKMATGVSSHRVHKMSYKIIKVF